MSIAKTTEARDQAAKELNTGAGKSKKKLIGGAGGNKSADAPPERKIADGKKQAAAKKAAVKKQTPVEEKADTGRISAAKKKLTESRVPAANKTATASKDGSSQPPQAPGQAAVDAGPAAAERPPRRRGILPGTRAKAPATAPDDAKSLSWMATQAVKALDAVKASQLEQALALKASAETSQGEQALAWEDDGTTLDAGEPAGIPGEFIQTLAASPGMPSDVILPSGIRCRGVLSADTPPAVQPGMAATPPRIPAVARWVTARRISASMTVMLGILMMIGWLGYRHWIAVDHAASDVPAATSAIIEPNGPVTGVEMTAPPISVVAVPESTAGRTETPSADTDAAPSREPAADAPPAATTEHNEPVTPAAGPQEEAVAGNAPQPVQTNPASATLPDEGRPAAASPPATEAEVAAPKKPSPPPAATPPRYPANGYGYGYYPPQSSWQPYYQSAYPQAPPR